MTLAAASPKIRDRRASKNDANDRMLRTYCWKPIDEDSLLK